MSKEQGKVMSKMNNVMNYTGATHTRGMDLQEKKAVKSPPSEADADKRRKRIMQANNKAEKSSVLFGVDMGEVPTINKEMLARKLTLDIQEGRGWRQESQVHGKTGRRDDRRHAHLRLSNFLGSGTKLYMNKFNNIDVNNGKFCTIPREDDV